MNGVSDDRQYPIRIGGNTGARFHSLLSLLMTSMQYFCSSRKIQLRYTAATRMAEYVIELVGGLSASIT
jgi:hypothetical protein